MRVRLLSDWADPTHPFHPAGAVLDVEPATAVQLLHGGRAEPIAPRPELASLGARERATRRRGKPRKRR